VKHHPDQLTRASCLTISAGLAVSFLAASSALAVSDARLGARWGDWQQIGVLGSDVVIGSLDGGQPNVDHASFEGAKITQVAYPAPFPFGDQTFDRVNFVTAHATAAMGTIGARNDSVAAPGDFRSIIGFAPESSLISGNFAALLDPNTGTFRGATNESILFAMFAMTDQDFADVVWEPLGLPERYRVASVLNMPFGVGGTISQRAGTDVFGQFADIVASQTNATLIAAAGNFGADQRLEDIDPPQGSMTSPGSARNVIAVGFTDVGTRSTVEQQSSRGPSPAIDWRVEGQLIPQDAEFPLGVSPPSVSPVPEVRNGVDIVAPGVNMSLPGSPAAQAMNDTVASSAWVGTSFSSGVVAGAVGLLHDLHRKLYFQENPDADEFDPGAVLSPLVTKAILFNSANKETNWSNNARAGQDDGVDPGAVTTTTPFDEDAGAGRLDMRRMLRQYMGTPGLGGYRDITPETLDINNDPLVVAFRRNPEISDPDDPRMDFGSIPLAGPTSSGTYIMLDQDGFPLRVAGTDPTIPLINTFLNPDAGDSAGGPGGGLIQHSPEQAARSSSRPAPAAAPRDTGALAPPSALRPMQSTLEPPNQGEGDGLDTPGGGGGGLTTTGTGGLTGGSSDPLPGGGSGGGGIAGGGGGNTFDFFATGWDHGMIGKGTLNLPIGLVSEGSTITATLVWQSRLELDERLIDALAASVLPQNMSLTNDILLNDPETRREIELTAPYLPSAEQTLQRLREQDRTKTELEFDESGEPTIMAGVRVLPDDDDPPLPPAESDTPELRIDPNTIPDPDDPSQTIASPYNGVCFIEIPSLGVQFTGVAIGGGVDGARHILTAAHPFDPDNNGTIDTSPSDLRIVFNGVPQFDEETGEVIDFGVLELPTNSVQRIDVPDAFVGIGVNFDGQVRGFDNDLAVLTIRPDALGETSFDLNDFGVNVYPTFTGETSVGTEFIMVGYGETGQGDLGFTPQSDQDPIPMQSAVKRIGGNIIDRRDGNSFMYDFDGPGIPFLQGEFPESVSLGNRNNFTNPNGMPVGLMNPVVFGESLHGEGDSGSPAFRWFDSGDGQGGPPDGKVQPVELRVFGVNTFRQLGNAMVMGAFGTTGGGIQLQEFGTFLSESINPPTPPPPPDDLGPGVGFNQSAGRPEALVANEFQKLNLELWRLNTDGSGNRLAGASTSEWEQVELVRITGEENVPTAVYFLRIVYEGTQWDFGGFRFTGIESTPQINDFGVDFTNFFDGDIEYGLAWFVDLVRDRNLFPDAVQLDITADDLMGDMNGDGLINGADLGSLLSLWGSHPETGRGDLNGDGVVDSGDLTVLLKNYTGPSRTTTTAASR